MDAGVCTGCGECEDTCFIDAIKVVDDTAVIGEYCRASGRSATACPNDAVTVRMTDPELLEEAYRQIGTRVRHTWGARA